MKQSNDEPNQGIQGRSLIEYDIRLGKRDFHQLFNSRQLLSSIYDRLISGPSSVPPAGLAELEELNERFLIASITYRAETLRMTTLTRATCDGMAELTIALPQHTVREADDIHNQRHLLRRDLGIDLSDHHLIEWAIKSNLYTRLQHLPNSFLPNPLSSTEVLKNRQSSTSKPSVPDSVLFHAFDDKCFLLTLPNQLTPCSVSFLRTPSILEPTPISDGIPRPQGTPHSVTSFLDNFIWEFPSTADQPTIFAVGQERDRLTLVGGHVEVQRAKRTIARIGQSLDLFYQ